ncbi:MAG: hypothetical protein A2W19_04460 [Spirochaetes bacterium RBG_16_49_21]|nr:MAG: hypothetical protein A2W19_04460 [Spirochaetes bacterium RBG_16_49_21]
MILLETYNVSSNSVIRNESATHRTLITPVAVPSIPRKIITEKQEEGDWGGCMQTKRRKGLDFQ